MLASLGRLIARHPVLVVIAWILAAGLGMASASGAFGEGLFDRLKSGERTVPGEAETGSEIIRANEPNGPSMSLLIDGVAPTEPALAPLLQQSRADLAKIPDVASVVDPLALPAGDPRAGAFVAKDGKAVLVSATVKGHLTGGREARALDAVHERLQQLGDEVEGDVPGSGTHVGGFTIVSDKIIHQVQDDMHNGEMLALPISLLIMVFVFGGFLAAGMPITGAVASIAGALASLLGISYVLDLDSTVVSVVTILGLGLSIDYGLLMVSRFREELRRRPDNSVPEALSATMATAGRTIVFSALTVAISLCGLLLFEAEILRAVASAGVSVVAVALLVAITLVPALLALAGMRMIRPGLTSRIPAVRALVTKLGDVSPPEGFFSRLGRRVQRSPWLVVLGVAAVLTLAAVPMFHMHMRSSSVDLLPTDDPERQFFETLRERFPGSDSPTVQVVGRATPQQMTGMAEKLSGAPGVARVDTPQALDPDYSLVNVYSVDADPGAPEGRAVVREARDISPGYPTWVDGQPAHLVDFTESLAKRAQWAIGVVVLATFVLLFLMTGSVLIPIKALLMNVMSLGASLGVLVWIFQEGHLRGLLDFASAGGIETSIPPLVLAFAFGLAMDYEVFLLARIKESHDAGLSNDDAVVAGLQRTGRIITSAALIVVAVCLAFVT
ncbi:MAG TPA: MMPL family transporter, partial [Actinomycetales bacterium]|nr:MMPL family transporter [Actinomycetales bacterium]